MRASYLGIWIAAGCLAASAGAGAATESVLYSFKSGTADGAGPEAGLLSSAKGILYGTTAGGGLSGGLGTVYALAPPTGGGTSWSETVVYRFKGGTDGDLPYSTLVADGTGALYGTTQYGGKHGFGTVFKLTPPGAAHGWVETVLHSFAGGNDGQGPAAGLAMDAQGRLYGTTEFGGTADQGTVFRLTPPTGSGTAWSLGILHGFKGGTDGAAPIAAVILEPGGAVDGTTGNGGSANMGTVFRLTPPASGQTAWSERIVHVFTGGNDGSVPAGSLIIDSSGALYGTTNLGGGTANAGIAFELIPPATGQTAWTRKLLHSFKGGSDGAYPAAGLTAGAGGVLYGTTRNGGAQSKGTIFKLKPPVTGTTWSESVLHSFGSAGDGALSDAGLVIGKGGALYGTTVSGGSGSGGTVFELVP